VIVLAALSLTSCGAYGKHQRNLNQLLLNTSFDGTSAAVTRLLETGANPNAKGAVDYHPVRETLSALEVACANSQFNAESGSIVKILLKRGARPTVKALVLALDGPHAEIVAELIKAGVDVNEKAKINGREILPITACVTSSMSSATSAMDNLRALLEAGAYPDALDASGRTPLLIAASASPTPVSFIDRLVSNGADTRAKGPDGKTVLDLLRQEETRCHTPGSFRPGMCVSTEATIAQIATAPSER
jgi:ankyrin repeat protein